MRKIDGMHLKQQHWDPGTFSKHCFGIFPLFLWVTVQYKGYRKKTGAKISLKRVRLHLYGQCF